MPVFHFGIQSTQPRCQFSAGVFTGEIRGRLGRCGPKFAQIELHKGFVVSEFIIQMGFKLRFKSADYLPSHASWNSTSINVKVNDHDDWTVDCLGSAATSATHPHLKLYGILTSSLNSLLPDPRLLVQRLLSQTSITSYIRDIHYPISSSQSPSMKMWIPRCGFSVRTRTPGRRPMY